MPLRMTFNELYAHLRNVEDAKRRKYRTKPKLTFKELYTRLRNVEDAKRRKRRTEQVYEKVLRAQKRRREARIWSTLEEKVKAAKAAAKAVVAARRHHRRKQSNPSRRKATLMPPEASPSCGNPPPPRAIIVEPCFADPCFAAEVEPSPENNSTTSGPITDVKKIVEKNQAPHLSLNALKRSSPQLDKASCFTLGKVGRDFSPDFNHGLLPKCHTARFVTQAAHEEAKAEGRLPQQFLYECPMRASERSGHTKLYLSAPHYKCETSTCINPTESAKRAFCGFCAARTHKDSQRLSTWSEFQLQYPRCRVAVDDQFEAWLRESPADDRRQASLVVEQRGVLCIVVLQ